MKDVKKIEFSLNGAKVVVEASKQALMVRFAGMPQHFTAVRGLLRIRVMQEMHQAGWLEMFSSSFKKANGI